LHDRSAGVAIDVEVLRLAGGDGECSSGDLAGRSLVAGLRFAGKQEQRRAAVKNHAITGAAALILSRLAAGAVVLEDDADLLIRAWLQLQVVAKRRLEASIVGNPEEVNLHRRVL